MITASHVFALASATFLGPGFENSIHQALVCWRDLHKLQSLLEVHKKTRRCNMRTLWLATILTSKMPLQMTPVLEGPSTAFAIHRLILM